MGSTLQKELLTQMIFLSVSGSKVHKNLGHLPVFTTKRSGASSQESNSFLHQHECMAPGVQTI
jgi:hypothetical protein